MIFPMVISFMFKPIRELRRLNVRMTTALNELEFLEDGKDMDYEDTIKIYRWIVQECEDRRERLQRRGRTQ